MYLCRLKFKFFIMDKNLSEIRHTMLKEFELFQHNLAASFDNTEGILAHKIFNFVQGKSGKQLRPMLVLLAAQLCGKITKQTHQAAVAVELLHTASLLHDDVVDETLERRGDSSVNAQFGNQTAVLTGDLLLIKAMQHILHCNKNAVQLFVDLGQKITGGELLQLEHSFTFLSENHYFEIIQRKTAALFSVCLKLGAMTAGASAEMIDKLGKFGEYLGICFQIKDDIFDYTPQAEIGKPTLNDIREGKITLPLMCAVRKATNQEKIQFGEILASEKITDEMVVFVGELVKKYNGTQLATQKMEIVAQQANKILKTLPSSTESEALKMILDYSMQRTN